MIWNLKHAFTQLVYLKNSVMWGFVPTDSQNSTVEKKNYYYRSIPTLKPKERDSLNWKHGFCLYHISVGKGVSRLLWCLCLLLIADFEAHVKVSLNWIMASSKWVLGSLCCLGITWAGGGQPAAHPLGRRAWSWWQSNYYRYGNYLGNVSLPMGQIARDTYHFQVTEHYQNYWHHS